MKNIKTFYFSILAITLLVMSVFIVTSLVGNFFISKNDGLKRIYFVDNISAGHSEAIEKFNRLHAGQLEVVPINFPFEKFSTNERKELLIRYLRGESDRVDVFSVDLIWVPRFAKWTEPLGQYFSVNERQQLLDPVLQTCYYKDQLMAIPLYMDVQVMYYRNDLLRTLPDYARYEKALAEGITWENFIELAEKFKAENSAYIFPGYGYEGLMCSFAELCASQNFNLSWKDTLNLNTPQTRKSLQLLVDLINKYNVSPSTVTNFKETQAEDYFIKQNSLFLRDWPGFRGTCENTYASFGLCDKLVAVPTPYFEGGRRASVIGGWNMMVSKSSTRKKEAVEFIKFMIEEEQQKLLYERNGFLPINRKIYGDSLFLKKHPRLKFFSGLTPHLVSRPFHEKYTKQSDVIAHFLNRALKKEISVEQALISAEKILNSGETFIK